jgi:hypothetical protein
MEGNFGFFVCFLTWLAKKKVANKPGQVVGKVGKSVVNRWATRSEAAGRSSVPLPQMAWLWAQSAAY